MPPVSVTLPHWLGRRPPSDGAFWFVFHRLLSILHQIEFAEPQRNGQGIPTLAAQTSFDTQLRPNSLFDGLRVQLTIQLKAYEPFEGRLGHYSVT